MTAELQQATQGMASGFKLTPVQFEKVGQPLDWRVGQQFSRVVAGHNAPHL
jgi:hypothetical protein